MKIYITNVSNNLSNVDAKRIQNNLYKSNINNLIYSYQGVFKLINDKIIYQTVLDKPIKEYYINDIKCLIDDSNINYDEEYYQLPFNHKNIITNVKYYHLRNKALVDFVIEECDDNIVDLYFITNENLDNKSIQEDIVTLLSLLKLY